MALTATARWAPYEAHERVSSFLGGGSRARMVAAAGPVDFARCDACQANARALCAPDRPVTVPNARRGAGEGLAGGHNCCGEEEEKRHAGRLCLQDSRDNRDESTLRSLLL